MGVLIPEVLDPPAAAGGAGRGGDFRILNPCLVWSLRGRVGHKGSPLHTGFF